MDFLSNKIWVRIFLGHPVSAHSRGHVLQHIRGNMYLQHLQVVIFTPVHVPANTSLLSVASVYTTQVFLSLQRDPSCLSNFKAKTTSRTAGTSSENITVFLQTYLRLINQDHLPFSVLKMSSVELNGTSGLEKKLKKSFCFRSQGQKIVHGSA